MSSLFASLKKDQKSTKLDFGIHSNIALRKVDITEHVGSSGPSAMFLFLNFVKIENNNIVGEFEASWFKPKNTDEKPFEKIRELCIQVDALLKCFYTEEEVDEVMSDLFKMNEWVELDDMKDAKYSSEALKIFMSNFQERVYKLLHPKVGQTQEDAILRLKVCLNKKGDNVTIPTYGAFTELMSVPEEATQLYFSEFEKKNNSKQGNTISAPVASMSNI